MFFFVNGLLFLRDYRQADLPGDGLFKRVVFNPSAHQVIAPGPGHTPVRGAVAAKMVIVMPAQMLFGPSWVKMSLAMLVVIKHQGCIHRVGK